jgi:hypothetical protein
MGEDIIFKGWTTLLFDLGESICSGGLYDTNIEDGIDSVKDEFFCINPLSIHDWEFGEKEGRSFNVPRRADMNVTSFRNFLFEMDTITLYEQLEILRGCDIPWTSIVYSGGKSYHAILSLEQPLSGVHTDAGIRTYKAVWAQLAAKINEYSNSLGYGSSVIDTSCKNPSRLSRVPFFVRSTGIAQDLKHLGDRIGIDEFRVLLQNCPIVEPSQECEVYEGSTDSLDEFWKLCPSGLQKKIKYPFWVDSAGMYPELYKLTLWCIDSTGATKELLESVYDRHVFPRLAELGYDRSRAMIAVTDAYLAKGA